MDWIEVGYYIFICPLHTQYDSSGGGKSGAVTIETDHEYAVAVAALLKKNKPAVLVEFDIDQMEGFRICKRVGGTVVYVFV